MSEASRREAEEFRDFLILHNRIGDFNTAIARALTKRDTIYERDVRILTGEHKAELARAVERERRRLADWFQETFCPRSGVPGDETHTRGDCDYCNIAAALRAPGEKA